MKIAGGVLASLALGASLAATAEVFEFAADRECGLYRLGETARITMTVREKAGGPLLTNGTYDVYLDNFGGKRVKGYRFDLAKGNPVQLEGSLTEPGFLRAVVACKGVIWSVGYEPEKIRAGAARPADFDAWWAERIRRLDAEVPPDVRLVKDEKASNADVTTWRVSFATAGGGRVWGFLTVPNDRTKGPFRTEFNVPGAGMGVFGHWRGGNGKVSMTMNVHSFEPGIELKDHTTRYNAQQAEIGEKWHVKNYWCGGFAGKREDCFYYPAILGINRALRWLSARPEVDPGDINYFGGSQGGAFGLFLSGLNPGLFRKVYIDVPPALCDHDTSKTRLRAGWPQVAACVDKKDVAAVLRNAPYYDGVNFAYNVTSPVRMINGFGDIMCPPTSASAAFNVIPAKGKICDYVVNGGHGHPTPKDVRDEAAAWFREPPPPLALPIADTVVVTGREASVGFAVHELNEIVKKATGKTFKVEGEGEQRTAHRIFLGRSAEVEKILGTTLLDGLGEQESLVFARNGDLFILGGDEIGLLWAVYDFVEENLGYHWYFRCEDKDRADYEIVDTCDTVMFKGRSTRRAPAFLPHRLDHWNCAEYALFGIRNRMMNRIDDYIAMYGPKGYQSKYLAKTCGHGFDFFLPRDMKSRIMVTVPKAIRERGSMWEQHPEYFSMDEKGKRSDKMQLCFSNPATRKALNESIALWVADRGSGTYMVGVNDEYGGRLCFCPGCRALEEKYGCMGGPLWDYILELCEQYKDRRDVRFTSLAYRWQTQMAPKGVRFPDNFIADTALALWDRAPHEVKPENLTGGNAYYDMCENLRAWSRCCRTVSYWYYGSTCAGYVWGRLQQEIDDLKATGVNGVGYCGLEGGFEFRDIVGYLRFRILSDMNFDAKKEFAKIAALKYGPAAGDILAYTEVLENIRLREVGRTQVGATAIDLFQFATPKELLVMQRIHERAQAKVAGTKYERAVAWARMSLDVSCALRGDQIRRIEPAFDPEACEKRARAAVADFKTSKLFFPRRDADGISNRLDTMYNYRFLKSDELPAELRKYPKDKVHRILPPKARPAFGGDFAKWSAAEPDPSSICGFAITTPIEKGFAKEGRSAIRLGIWSLDGHCPLIPIENNLVPESFWQKDRYALFRVGTSRYSSGAKLNFSDLESHSLGIAPINTMLISRVFDTINVDRQYETWVSMKVEGPKFWPGDTRPDKLLIEQIFVVEL